jgi:hypothetical protein
MTGEAAKSPALYPSSKTRPTPVSVCAKRLTPQRDPRNPLLITHSVAELLRQRVYGLALGWVCMLLAALGFGQSGKPVAGHFEKR